MDGSLENAYQETKFNPARYCASVESLECVNNVVEVLCENLYCSQNSSITRNCLK